MFKTPGKGILFAQTENIALQDFLPLAALIVAIIAILVAVWATRRWGNRRAKVQFEFRSLPLLRDDMKPGLLEVTYRDMPVKKPHLVSVTIENVGPRDIPSSAFDAGKPISVTFNQTFYGLTSTSGGVHTTSPAIGTPANDAIVLIQPGLLKRREAWSFSAVLSGPAEISVESPLIDTDMRQVDLSDEEAPEVTVNLPH